MKNLLKILASFTGHSLYLVGSMGFSLIVLPVAIFCKCINNHKVPSILVYYSLAFFVRKVLTGLKVIKIEEVEGLDKISSLGPAVYICNHRGKLDGPLVLSLVNFLKPTMKSKYARRPIFRIFVKWFDFCEVDIKSTNGLVQTDKKCSEILQKQSILFFPEGTRKPGNRLSDFKKMAFKIAANNDVPIIPVLLYNSVPFMTKKLSSFFPLERVRFKIHFLDPIYPAGKCVNDLTNDAYLKMSEELQKMLDI